MKTCFYVKLADNLIFKNFYSSNSLIAFFLVMFLQNGVLQITDPNLPQKSNLRYLTEAIGENG